MLRQPTWHGQGGALVWGGMPGGGIHPGKSVQHGGSGGSRRVCVCFDRVMHSWVWKWVWLCQRYLLMSLHTDGNQNSDASKKWVPAFFSWVLVTMVIHTVLMLIEALHVEGLWWCLYQGSHIERRWYWPVYLLVIDCQRGWSILWPCGQRSICVPVWGRFCIERDCSTSKLLAWGSWVWGGALEKV